MRREYKAYLWDIQDRGTAILRFVGVSTEEEYLANEMLRAAVERHLSVIGEAVVQIKIHFPERVNESENYSQIIGFRNQLIHNYDDLSPRQIWLVIQTFLPQLLSQVAVILDRTPFVP